MALAEPLQPLVDLYLTNELMFVVRFVLRFVVRHETEWSAVKCGANATPLTLRR